MHSFIKQIGYEHSDIVLKSDQEHSIKDLLKEIGRRHAARGGRVLPENSPVGSSASNGVAERAVQCFEGQIRVLRLALEERWSTRLQEDHRIWAHLVEYSGFLRSRCEVGHDGKTAYERMKGKTAPVLGLEFMEIVM